MHVHNLSIRRARFVTNTCQLPGWVEPETMQEGDGSSSLSEESPTFSFDNLEIERDRKREIEREK